MTVEGLYHEESIEMAASPTAAYELVSDVGRMADWSPEVTGAQWLDGGSGNVGDTFQGHNKIGDREWSVVCTVVAANPGEEFSFTTGPPDEPYVQWTYRIAASDGGSQVTEIWNVHKLPPTLESRTPEQLGERTAAVQSAMQATLSAMKADAEG